MRAELFDGERLFWAQRPKRGVTFLSDDVRTTIFMLMWTAFSCFWIFPSLGVRTSGDGALRDTVRGRGPLPPDRKALREASERERIFYAITDRRVLVVTTRLRAVKQHAIDRIPTTAAMATSSGYGSIWLDVPSYTSWEWPAGRRDPGASPRPERRRGSTGPSSGHGRRRWQE